MSAFTYDSWLTFSAKYRNNFGVYFYATRTAKRVFRPVFATPRILADDPTFGFNDTFYDSARDWNFAGTPGVVTKRDIITEVFFTELDTVFNGPAAYAPSTSEVPNFSTFHETVPGVPTTLSATPVRTSDSLFPGRFYYQGFQVSLVPVLNVQDILNLIIPPGTSIVTLRLAYTTTMFRSPAPNLTWSGISDAFVVKVGPEWIPDDPALAEINFGPDFTQEEGPILFQRIHNVATHSITVYWMLFYD